MSAFRRVVHCDWSKNPGGRWQATATRGRAGWSADGPAPVPADMPAFVADLLDPDQGPTLAAFDFPVGLPALLRRPMGCDAFPEALERFGEGGPLEGALRPAATPGEIGALRPFYPDKVGAARQAHLLRGLGAASMADLLRACEKGGGGGGGGAPAAGCMLWLVGARTVGKAAIHGWTAVVRPARARGARLWPFDGDLPALAAAGGLTIAESYPADAVRQIGARVRGKTRPAALRDVAPALLAFAAGHGIALSAALHGAIGTGFSAFGGRRGDAFDAVVGLFAALAVADGTRRSAPDLADETRRWEGWILGRG